MAVLSPNSTLGSNVIFTTQDDAITSNVFYELPDLGATAKSGAAIFKHANGTIQYGYLAADTVVAYGDTEGYISGGQISISPSTTTDSIQSFPFVNGTSMTNVKNLIAPNIYIMGGFNSTTHGYTAGGRRVPTGDIPLGITSTDAIEKFSFADLNPSSSVGTLSSATFGGAGHSSTSYGYASGGRQGPPFVYVATIDKFPYTSEGSASNIGSIVQTSMYHAGHSSSTDGYVSGGSNPPATPVSDVIQRFPFSSNSPSTDIGELTQARQRSSGSSSSTHGYTTGGLISQANSSNIEKFTFSSSSTSSSVGDLTWARQLAGGGNSSTTDGYSSGGVNPFLSPAFGTSIDKYPFSSDTPATTIPASLSVGTTYSSSQNS